MDTKFVLTHLIRAGRDALHLEKTLNDLGYKETPYYNLYGEIVDAIYGILEEDTESIEESKAVAAINDIYTPDEMCAEELAQYVKNSACPDLNLSDTTTDVIIDAAAERGIEPEKMIKLILSEWAMKELFSQSVMR